MRHQNTKPGSTISGIRVRNEVFAALREKLKRIDHGISHEANPKTTGVGQSQVKRRPADGGSKK